MNDRQLKTIRDVLGAQRVEIDAGGAVVDGRRYPVIDDVVILVDPAHYTPYVRSRLRGDAAAGIRGPQSGVEPADGHAFALDIQRSFGAEWTRYSEILPEHRREFEQYFDILDPKALRGRRVADLGCGSGRWSFFLRDVADALVLVDFSDAIFVARRNLDGAPHAVFFMADLMQLPFRDDCFDLAFSIGVLHHLPSPCLDAVRKIGRLSPQLLVYLYYALDNRPALYRAMLLPVNAVRRVMSRVHSEFARRAFARAVTWTVYVPLIALGRVIAPLGLSTRVPLYDFYAGKSRARIEQDVYDRFFTGIEQRVTRAEIQSLRDTFRTVTISSGLPYWHFLCERLPGNARADEAPRAKAQSMESVAP